MIDADNVESAGVVPENGVAGEEQQRRAGQFTLLASVYREASLNETAGAAGAYLDEDETGWLLHHEVDFPVPRPEVACDRGEPLPAQEPEHEVLGAPA